MLWWWALGLYVQASHVYTTDCINFGELYTSAPSCPGNYLIRGFVKTGDRNCNDGDGCRWSITKFRCCRCDSCQAPTNNGTGTTNLGLGDGFWNSVSQNTSCGTNYFFGGLKITSDTNVVQMQAWQGAVCARPPNLNGYLNSTLAIRPPPNWATSNSVFECPVGSFVSGLFTLPSGPSNKIPRDVMDFGLLCNFPQDQQCSTVLTNATYRSTVVYTNVSGVQCKHQGCTATQVCLPGYKANITANNTVLTCDVSGIFKGTLLQCVNMNECARPCEPGEISGIQECNDCHPNASCTNTEGGKTCTCKAGYSGNGTTCANVNECVRQCSVSNAQDTPEIGQCNNCTGNRTCVDSEGWFSCPCLSGFTSASCTDVNECSRNCSDANSTQCNKCASVATCSNTIGSYSCACPSGYSTSDGGFTCTDVDECASPCGPGVVTNCHNCQGLFQCNNTIGRFTCVCRAGYQLNGSVCQNVNECDANSTIKHNCSLQSTCVDTDGSFYCSPYVSFASINNTTLSTSALILPGGTRQAPADVVLIVIRGLVAPFGWDNITNYGSDVNPTRYQATNCSRIYSGATINVTCRLSPGSGAKLAFAFQYTYPGIAQQTLQVKDRVFSYPSPQLLPNTLRQNVTMTNDLTVQTQFGQSPLVAMNGSNLPLIAADATVFVGTKPFICAIETISSTSLSCRLSPDAVGVNMTFSLVTGTGTSLQIANGTDRLTIVLIGPKILSLSADNCSQLTSITIGNCPTTGNNLVTVLTDQNLTNPVLMLIAGGSCVNPVIGSVNTSFTCLMPAGTGVNLPTAFAHDLNPRFSSILKLVSYAAPTVFRLQTSACTSTSNLTLDGCSLLGGETLSIFGQNFGSEGAVVRVGSVSVPAFHTAGSEHVSLLITLPSYASVSYIVSNDIVVVQSGGQSSSQAASLTFVPLCGGGQYEDKGVCLPCRNGTYSVTAVRCSSECVSCPRGMFQDSEGSTSCDACPAGRFQSESGRSSCDSCLPGSYSAALGEGSCSLCPVGRFSDIASSACTTCGPGTFQPSMNQSECLECSAGRFTDIPEQVECSSCPAGRINKQASSQCSSCVPGRFNVEKGSSECNSCAPGSFSDQYGWAFDCLLCSPGRYQDSNSSTTCMDCNVGSEQPLSNQIACSPCNPGTYAATNGQSSCSLCDSGSYTASYSATICSDCDVGSYQVLKGASNCSGCPVGMWNRNYGSSSCLTCSPGFYQDELAQTSCMSCNAGKYSLNEKASACLQCTIGSFQAAQGQTVCQACPAGRFGNDTGRSFCGICAAGYYTAVAQATTCTYCVPGRYQSLQGQSVCSKCADGESSPNRGAMNCTKCEAGKYQADLESPVVCTSCAMGNYTQAAGATICGVCGPGKFSDRVGATTCTDCVSGLIWDITSGTCKSCPAGKSSDSLGEVCTFCFAGKYSSSPGTPCLDCLPGFVSGNGSTTCTACEPGFHAPGGAQSLCILCSPTHYAPFRNASGCLSCPSESKVDRTNTSCSCNPGYYSIMAENGQYFCTRCITGMRCTESGVTVKSVQTLNGYWRINQTSDFVRCPRQQYCLGGSAKGNICQPHRTGVLCGLCEVGYQANSASGVCELCPEQKTSFTYSILILLLMAFLIILMFYIVLRFSNMQHKALRERITRIEMEDRNNLEATLAKYNNQDVAAVESDFLEGEDAIETRASFCDKSELEQQRILRTTQGRLARENGAEIDGDIFKDRELAIQRDSSIAERPSLRRLQSSLSLREMLQRKRSSPNFMYKVKILVGFFQVASILPLQGGIQWPTAFADFISAFAFLNFDFMPWQSIGCVASISYFDKAIIVGCTPLCVLAALLLFFYAPAWIYNNTDTLQEQLVKQQRQEHLNRQFVKLTLFTVFLLYPFVSKTVLGVFNCIEVDGTSYLLQDLSLLCFTDHWSNYAGVCGLFVAMYPIGIPLVYFLLLRRAELRDPGTTFMLGFLYEAYVAHCYYWEIVDMLHKLLLTGIVAFAPANIQLVANMPILIFYLIVLLWTQPYVRKGDDRFHLLVQIELYLLALVGWILTPPNAAELTPETDLLISLLLIGLTAFLMSSFIIIAGRNVLKLVKQKFNKRKQKQKSASAPVSVSGESATITSSSGV